MLPYRLAVTVRRACVHLKFVRSGFGLLESGCVSPKNEVNIMYKNAVDVIFGGTIYYLFGYGLSYGAHRFANEFCGWGNFALTFQDGEDRNAVEAGDMHVSFVFQVSDVTM